jgi:hypothetical protein
MATVFGNVALFRIRKDSSLDGKAIAVVSIVVGGLEMAWILILLGLAGWLWQSFLPGR